VKIRSSDLQALEIGNAKLGKTSFTRSLAAFNFNVCKCKRLHLQTKRFYLKNSATMQKEI
jgi:hypothetical protein